MARLIDADYFEENGYVHTLGYYEECIGKFVFYDTIKGAPTVEAIPIEWIRKKSDEVLGLPEVPMSLAYVALINQWRKEHGKEK